MSKAEVIWAARWEMARTVEDVLSRRTRALLLNARAAIAMAPRVAELLAAELGYTEPGSVARLTHLRISRLPICRGKPTVCVKCSMTPDRWQTDYRVMAFVEKPGGSIKTRASFVVENGRPGAERL